MGQNQPGRQHNDGIADPPRTACRSRPVGQLVSFGEDDDTEVYPARKTCSLHNDARGKEDIASATTRSAAETYWHILRYLGNVRFSLYLRKNR